MSKKKEGAESRFAFARFKSFEEAARCIRLFQSSLYLGNKLVLSHAVDGGRRQFWKRVWHESGSSEPSGASGVGSMCKSPSVSRVPAIEDHNFMQALKRSVIGKLPEDSNFADIQSELCGKRNLDVVVRLLSDREVIVEFSSGVMFTKEYLENFPSLRNCFDEIRIWCEPFEPDEREVWIRISGLPLRFWGLQSFENIAKLWGSLISVKAETEKGLDLRHGYIQIKSGKIEKIDEEIEMCYGDSVFRVNICEMPVENLLRDSGSVSAPVHRPMAAPVGFLNKKGDSLVDAVLDEGASLVSSTGPVQSMVATLPRFDEGVPRLATVPENNGTLVMAVLNDAQFHMQCSLAPDQQVVSESGSRNVEDGAVEDLGPEVAVDQQRVGGEGLCENEFGLEGVVVIELVGWWILVPWPNKKMTIHLD